MKQVYSRKDIEDFIRQGRSAKDLPADAILTPSARDALSELELGGIGRLTGSLSAAPAKPLNSKSPKAELEAYFNSPAAHALKEQICAMGKRLWEREYVDGNGGNIAIRVGEDIALPEPASNVAKLFFERACLRGVEVSFQLSLGRL